MESKKQMNKRNRNREFPGGLWLGFGAFTAVTQVQSLVGKPSSHKLHGGAKKKKVTETITDTENKQVVARGEGGRKK